MVAILLPAKVGDTVAAAIVPVVAYFIALFVKQVILKKPGGLFTAKF
jgi:hypothetical protein